MEIDKQPIHPPPTPVILAGGPLLITKARKLHPHHQVHWGENGFSVSRWSISTPTHWIHGIGIGKPEPRERENMGPTEKEEKENFHRLKYVLFTTAVGDVLFGSQEGTYVWLIFVGLYLTYHTWMLREKIFPLGPRRFSAQMPRCPFFFLNPSYLPPKI